MTSYVLYTKVMDDELEASRQHILVNEGLDCKKVLIRARWGPRWSGSSFGMVGARQEGRGFHGGGLEGSPLQLVH
jgi:hypothetical protein